MRARDRARMEAFASTARPGGADDKPFRPSDRPDYFQDWGPVVPYSRCRERGHVIRVETDGRGGLIEFIETSTGELLWGATRGQWNQLRSQKPKVTRIATGNLKLTAARLGREYRLLGYLSQTHGGQQPGELNEHFGVDTRTIAVYLWRLHDMGYVRYEPRHEPIAHGGSRACKVWYACDDWRDYLADILMRLVLTKPMTASTAAALLGVGYEQVVRVLAQMARSGELERERTVEGYLYMERADIEIGNW